MSLYFNTFVSIILLISLYQLKCLQEAPDGSVCFDNCNGHGHCIDYSCHCYVGYHGDDCKTTWVVDEDHILPILGAGHYNVSKNNFTSIITKNNYILVGFSSYNCFKCIQAENEYEKISNYLLENKVNNIIIPFARANVDQMKSIVTQYEINDLPALVFFKKQRANLYKGSHRSEAVITYIHKQIGIPYTVLKSVDDIDQFISSKYNNISYSLSTVSVIGFFSSHNDMEEDEYEEFVDTAKELQSNENIYFGIVINKQLCNIYKRNRTIDRTPSVLLITDQSIQRAINLDELFGERIGLSDWILRNSIPLVNKLTSSNFQLYEKTNLPMLLLFLNLTEESSNINKEYIEGTSGEISNEILINEFKKVAKEYYTKINFVYLSGIEHEDQMRSLGLYHGKRNLPAIAFNTKNKYKIPFPEDLPINYDTLNQFCSAFLSGTLRSPKDSIELAQKALKTVSAMNMNNLPKRNYYIDIPNITTGISEQFDGTLGDEYIVEITSDNFNEIALDDEKDVVIVLYKVPCESCNHLAVYYKRMAQRFFELNIPSLVIAKMDVTNDVPPTEISLIVSSLPLIVILPAYSKNPPYSYYSGISKVQPMMKWIEQEANVKFTLPNLPHLNENNSKLYKEQIREREEYLDKKRREDELALLEEEYEQKQAEERRLKRLNKDL